MPARSWMPYHRTFEVALIQRVRHANRVPPESIKCAAAAVVPVKSSLATTSTAFGGCPRCATTTVGVSAFPLTYLILFLGLLFLALVIVDASYLASQLEHAATLESNLRLA